MLDKIFDDKKKIVIDVASGIEDDDLRSTYIEYVLEDFDKFDVSKNDTIIELLNRISNSNSLEISRIKKELTSQLIKLDNPFEKLEEIENIYIKNNLPAVGKAFLVFDILNPKLNDSRFRESASTSPVLKSQTPEERKKQSLMTYCLPH